MSNELKPIPGYEGYWVTQHGRMWSEHRGGRWMKLSNDGNGPKVSTVVHGKRRSLYVHAAVLLAWVGPRPEGMEACHNDGAFMNNNLSNLRWDTPEGNMKDRFKHNATGITLCADEVREIKRAIALGETLTSIAAKFNTSVSNVSFIKLGKTWAHVVTG